jgi:hypothetical protein
MADTRFDPSEVPGTAEYDHRTETVTAPTADISREMDEPKPARGKAARPAPDAPEPAPETAPDPPAETGTAGEEN